MGPTLGASVMHHSPRLKEETSNLALLHVATIDMVYVKHFFFGICSRSILGRSRFLWMECNLFVIVHECVCVVVHAMSVIFVIHPWATQQDITTIHWEHIAPKCIFIIFTNAKSNLALMSHLHFITCH